MNKTISMNIGGMVFQIEEQAYAVLKDYIGSLKEHFKHSEGGSDIVADIESRIAELFQEINKQGKAVIELRDVEKIMENLGRVEDMMDVDEDEGDKSHQKRTEQAFEANDRKKLYRDPDERMIGGVCAGLGHFLGIDTVWVRLMFVLIGLVSFGTGVVVYFILWVVVPEAISTSDRLRMKGKPVNISNIEASFKKGVSSINQEINDFVNDKNRKERLRHSAKEAEGVMQRLIMALAQVGMFVGKAFLKFLAVMGLVIGLAMLVFIVFTVIGAAGLGGFVLHDILPFVFESGIWATTFVVSGLFVVMVPLVMLMVRAVQHLMGQPPMDRGYRLGAFGIWIIGLFTLFGLGIHLAILFRASASTEKSLPLAISGSRLTVFSIQPHARATTRYISVGQGSFNTWSNDLFYTNNGALYYQGVSLAILQSPDNAFHLLQRHSAQGKHFEEAVQHAGLVNYDPVVGDSTLTLDPYMSLVGPPFRNQRVHLEILVPVGGEIVFPDRTYGIDNHIGRLSGDYLSYPGKVYAMRADGKLDEISAVKRNQTGQMRLYDLAGFTSVEIRSKQPANFIITEGKAFEVTVSEAMAQGDELHITQRGGKLVVDVESGWDNHHEEYAVHISCPKILKVSALGLGTYDLALDDDDGLDLELGGACKGTLNGKPSYLNMTTSGMSAIDLWGLCGNLSLESSGKSTVRGFEMTARKAQLDISGMSEIECHVTEHLEIDVSGSSTVRYKGSPMTEQHVSGISKIENVAP